MRPSLASGLLALAVALSLAAVAHQATRRAPDFATRYAAGVAVARGLDPYDPAVVNPIENGHLDGRYDYPFRDPPPVAWGFRAVAAAPYRVAERLWLLVLLASAGACTLLALRATGFAAASLGGAAIVTVVALDFAPLRNAIAELQLDPLIGALALVAFASARRPWAGALQSLATLKPQAALLGSAGGIGAGRVRFAAGLAAGWAALVLATALAPGPRWGAWLRAAHRASRAHGGAHLAAGGLVALAAVVLALLALRRSREPVELLAVATALNGTLAPLIFLNPQSDVLVLVPLLLLVRRGANDLVLGAAAGVFCVSGLFAVTYHSGLVHAAYPALVAVTLAVWVALRWPARWTAAATALAVNLAVTVAPLPPRAYGWLGVAACLALLGLLAARADTPVAPARPASS